MEHVRAVGPIPRGKWRIGRPYKHATLGPICFNLEPVGHDALSRTLFRIHGDNKTNDASLGCIILGWSIRRKIELDGETELEVI